MGCSHLPSTDFIAYILWINSYPVKSRKKSWTYISVISYSILGTKVFPLKAIRNIVHLIISYLFFPPRDVSVSFVACMIGGLVSVIMVYAWYGVVVQQSMQNNDTNITKDNVYHWISYVFLTFHEASVEGNRWSCSYRMNYAYYMYTIWCLFLYIDIQPHFSYDL